MTTASPPDGLLGQTLAGRYRLTRKVGEGGMGAVYEAVQEALGRTVAVKILRDKYADRPEVARRLVKEAQLASSIEHEHIVRILDSGATDDGRPFVVMEHLRGESLAERIRREGALPERFVVDVGLQVGRALEAAHARSIVHRDVKPENVLLVPVEGEGGRVSVKIVDFGISKSMAGEPGDSNLRLTATGMVLGTPLYMSPEQARGDDHVDHRVDIYALGVILYEALTGEVPFRGGNYLGVISQVLGAAVVPPRTLRPELGLSAAVEQVVLRAMARDPAQRHPTMAALVDELERVREGRPLAHVPATPVTPVPRTRRLWPIGVVAGVALFTLLTVPFLRPRPTALPPVVVPAPPAPPTVDAAAQVAALAVVSDPPGAEIFIGDRSYGLAPRSVTLARGPHELALRLGGYEDGSAKAVAGVDLEVTVRLRPSARPAVRTPPRPPGKRPPPPPRSDGKPVAGQGGETLPNPY
jgi:eukaryotic-like serine/threonine-protein kinase